MKAIRSKDTTPEWIVRRLVHGLGHRYRLHRKDLPGKPDLVFGPKRKAILVHGCFWHQHPVADCSDSRRPKSNTGYWRPKLDRNVERDAEHLLWFAENGWKILTVWDCETKNPQTLLKRLQRFLR
jgi:DNA mismatch endonuclease (patch repair protein)